MDDKINNLNLEGDSPLEMALRSLQNTSPDEARKIKKAIREGRLTVEDVISFAKERTLVQ